MTIEDVFSATTIKTWTTVIGRLERNLSSLSEFDMQSEVAPGRNRVYYILGHLTAFHDRLSPMLDLGERLYPELDELFVSSPDRTFPDRYVGSELRTMFLAVNARVANGIQTMSTVDFLKKHGAVSAEDFAKDPLRNRLAVLQNRTSHAAFHEGQIRLVRKA